MNQGHDQKPSSSPPSLGRGRVGRYEVLFPLASGGMASVYVGRLSGMAGFQRLVAIKVIHAHLAGESAFVKMFLDEARLAAGIHHPNVGEIMEVGEDDGILFMVGELVMGQSLSELFRRGSQMGVKISDDISAWIISRVCLALHAAHELHDHAGQDLMIVHRDVSPRNILVSYDGFVKLIDFGVAHAQGRLSHTDAGTLKGKIGYMPPEQIMGEAVDLRGDLFSLGVVLYRMVTGGVPFQGKSDGERIHKILKGDFLAPRKVAPEMDSVLEEIILRAMATDPKARYSSAAEMNADLETFLRSRSASVGSLQMAELMKSLFEEDIFEFQYRLKTAKVDSDETGAQEIPRALRSPKQGSVRSEPPTAAGTPSAIEHGTIRRVRTSKLALGLGLGVLLLVGVAIGWVALSGSEDEDDGALAGAEGEAAEPAAMVNAAKGVDPDAEPSEKIKEEARLQISKISLDVSPRDATVKLEGAVIQERELDLPADGEAREIEVTAQGFVDQKVTFVPDGDRVVEVRLERLKKKGKKGGKKKDLKLKGSPYG